MAPFRWPFTKPQDEIPRPRRWRAVGRDSPENLLKWRGYTPACRPTKPNQWPTEHLLRVDRLPKKLVEETGFTHAVRLIVIPPKTHPERLRQHWMLLTTPYQFASDRDAYEAGKCLVVRVNLIPRRFKHLLLKRDSAVEESWYGWLEACAN